MDDSVRSWPGRRDEYVEFSVVEGEFSWTSRRTGERVVHPSQEGARSFEVRSHFGTFLVVAASVGDLWSIGIAPVNLRGRPQFCWDPDDGVFRLRLAVGDVVEGRAEPSQASLF